MASANSIQRARNSRRCLTHPTVNHRSRQPYGQMRTVVAVRYDLPNQLPTDGDVRFGNAAIEHQHPSDTRRFRRNAQWLTIDRWQRRRMRTGARLTCTRMPPLARSSSLSAAVTRALYTTGEKSIRHCVVPAQPQCERARWSARGGRGKLKLISGRVRKCKRRGGANRSQG